jgi:predicted Zn-dependent protease
MTGQSSSPFDAAAVAVQQALQAAIAALNEERFGEAERIAAGILKDNPGHPVAGGILGRALLLQDRAAEAVPVLEQAVRGSNDPQAETQFADALVATGRRDEALAQLRQAMARRPAFLPSFVMYAHYSGEAGDHAAAIAALEQGLAIFPGTWEMEHQLALQQLKINDRVAARASVLRALAAQPGHPTLLAVLGQVLYFDADYAAAADAFAQALAANPADIASQINLGASRLALGDRDKGEAELRAAVRAAPQMANHAISALCHAPHGRLFLRISATMNYMRGKA